jgi:hypothetical protein
MADEYDFAFSFAGEQRPYVEDTVRACKARGLRVFYDRDKNNEWWGGNFIRQQRATYSSRTRYFVPFVSREYLSKPVPMDEFSAAMMTAVKLGDGYILPVLMDDVEVPADLLHPHVHYLHASRYTPDELAQELQTKLGRAKAGGQQPETLERVVGQALHMRMPKIVPDTWSKYDELDRVFTHLEEGFKQGSDQLRARGLAASVRSGQERLMVRVERAGETIAGIDVWRASDLGDDRIVWSQNWRASSSKGYNGWATVRFDAQAERAVVDVSDLTLMSRGQIGDGSTKEGFLEHLWNMVVDQVEGRL